MEEETIDPQSGQEQIQPLTTKNSVVKVTGKNGIEVDGQLVLPKEDTKIYASAKSKHLGAEGTPHTVHRVLADKLVKKGEATLDAPKSKKKEGEE